MYLLVCVCVCVCYLYLDVSWVVYKLFNEQPVITKARRCLLGRKAKSFPAKEPNTHIVLRPPTHPSIHTHTHNTVKKHIVQTWKQQIHTTYQLPVHSNNQRRKPPDGINKQGIKTMQLPTVIQKKVLLKVTMETATGKKEAGWREAGLPRLLVVPSDPHPFASAACRGFDHHRITYNSTNHQHTTYLCLYCC